MYPGLASAIENKLSGDEWSLVSYHINKADSLGDEANSSSVSKEEASRLEARARECIQDAVAIARSNGEYNAADKIAYYLRFY